MENKELQLLQEILAELKKLNQNIIDLRGSDPNDPKHELVSLWNILDDMPI